MNETEGSAVCQTLLIGQDDVEALLDMNETLAVVERP